MQFAKIPGLSDTKERLIDLVKRGNVAHALLFDGKSGSAALPMALAFATYINCEQPTAVDSCGQCSNCHKINKLSHPDLTFAFPTAGGKKVLSENFMSEWRDFVSENPFGTYTDWLNHINIKQGNIPVEESRQIIQGLSLKSYEGGYKMVVIWNVESMAAPAANSLLKILEEPPEKTIFLLITSDYNRLLPTIQSRVQRVAVSELTFDETVKFLIEIKHVSETRAGQIAFLTDGNINSSIKLIEQKDSNHKEWFANWMRYCYAFDLGKLVPASEEFDSLSKEEQKAMLEYGLKILREIYLQNVGILELIKLENEELSFVQKFSKVFKFENIDRISEAISEAVVSIDRNLRAKIVFMDLSMTISSLIK